MDVKLLLNEIEEIVEESATVPFSKKVMIEKEDILEIVSEIRQKLPQELKDAEMISDERQKIIDDAKKHSEDMLEETRMRVEEMIEKSKLVAQAKDRAEEIVDKANLSAKEIRSGAILYANDILSDIESKISNLSKEIDDIHLRVRENKDELK